MPSRNPIARHLHQHRHQVVADKRLREAVLFAVSEMEAEHELGESTARFDATKSDGTNYD